MVNVILVDMYTFIYNDKVQSTTQSTWNNDSDKKFKKKENFLNDDIGLGLL